MTIGKVLPLLYALLVRSQNIWLEIADLEKGSLVANGASVKVEDDLSGADSMRAKEVEIR